MTASRVQTQVPETLPVQMYGMLNAHFLVQALHAAATLRIADLLADGPKSVEELARASSSHAPSLYRLLRMLAGAGVFAEDESSRFMLTPLAATLRTDTPDSVRDWALFIAAPPVWAAWGTLLHSIRTGQSAFEHAFGMPLFKYMSDHSDLALSYNKWMAKQSERQNAAVLASYDFSIHRKIVDVGGGQGVTLVSILQTHPQATGVLFDLPQVVKSSLVPETLAERCQIVAGDMLQSVPAGGDAYVLKRVLLDWGDELATKVLINCCDAMQQDGKILVIEPVVPEGNDPSVSKFLDLIMLALQHGGRVRTEVEHRTLFEAAGLELTHVLTTPSPLCLLVGARRL
jgi:O-methyltransferase